MRVLIVGDSPRIPTGFGRVNAEAVKAFQSKGWDVASLGGLTDETTPTKDDGIKMYTPSGYKGDIWGFHDVPAVIKDYRPDVIYSTADPGTFVTATSVIPETEKLLGYLPIEGEPIGNRDWKRMLTKLPFFTCSRYGVRVVKENLGRDVEYVYHGLDHDTFNTSPRVNGLRDAVRKNMKWEGKYVIICVATNVRRKQIPRLIEAVSILKHEFKQKDIVLYLHTLPFNHYFLDGWNLPEVTELFGVNDISFFHPAMNKMNAGIPEVTGNPNYPGLAEIYNSADLFVLPSQVEGFGLPIAEAMACGLPVMVTKYAAGYEVSSPAGRGIPVVDYELHKSATKYANISPRELAKEILRLKRDPKAAQRMSDAGLMRVKDFQWGAFREKVISEVERVASGDQEGDSRTEEADTPEEAVTWQGDNLLPEGQGPLPKDQLQLTGQG